MPTTKLGQESGRLKRMLDDLVVDTNVLMHADDPRQPVQQEQARALLDRLLDAPTVLAVDEGFDVNSSRNRSQIGHEYLRNLTGASLGMQVIASLASNDRVRVTPRKVDQAIKKRINQLVRKKTDRSFLAVACNTESRTFCSHDFQDFQKAKRKTIAKDLTVHVCEAVDALGMLSDTE